MLVLHRKTGQIVDCRVGDIVISVSISKIRGATVSLGFTAPQEVRITRREAKNHEPKKDV